MAHAFAAPRRPAARSQSLRASLHGPMRKRKRDADDEESDSAGFSAGNDTPSTRATSAITTLTAAEAAQFRAAGHDPDGELPPAPFPHGPAASSTGPKLTPSEVQQELAALKPPLYAPGLSSAARLAPDPSQLSAGLRQHHLRVMTSLMHHCLLKGDYERAGRAWGMILRGSSSGKNMDVRTHARWGIGAEVLLHRGATQDGPRGEPGPSEALPLTANGAFFTEQGFKAARDYYDRLILQYPFRQSHPKATNALTFYPAMFGLWIYEVSQASRIEIARTENADSDALDNESDAMSASEDASNSGFSKRDARIMAVRADELRRAREIAARLDDLLTSPPFDKHADLLHLRGMIAMWIGDLIFLIRQAEGTVDTEVSPEQPERGCAERQEQVAKAKELFQRAKDNGGRLCEGANQVLGDVED